MQTYTPANSIFDGTTTNLHSLLCVLIEILLCAHVMGKKGFNNFKFGTFSGRFKSDSTASMAVKGLICTFGSSPGCCVHEVQCSGLLPHAAGDE